MITTKSNQRNKPNPTQNKSRPKINHLLHQCERSTFQLSRGWTPSSNMNSCSYLALFYLSQCRKLAILDYSPLMLRHDHWNCHGFNAYMKDGFPCGRDPQNKDSDFPFMCFCVALVHSMYFIFNVYHPQDDRIIMINKIAEKSDDILTEHPSVSIHNYGNFSIHCKE